MSLLQIAEPGQQAPPHQHRLAAGIDLGTTNSLIGSVISGSVELLPDQAGHKILPSVVHFAEHISIGAKAQEYLIKDSLNTVSSVKRMLGKSVVEAQEQFENLVISNSTDSNVPRINTAVGIYTAIDVSAHIIKKLVKRAENRLDGQLQGVVITVPAYFDDSQRQATRDAARIAGVEVLRLINEPTAAAIAYGFDRQPRGNFVVYDLGGGTFDVSVLSLSKGVFEVLATGGDSALGGDDMDRLIYHWLVENYQLADKDHVELKLTARVLKEQLTEDEVAQATINDTVIRLTRSQLDDLIDPLLDRTLKIAKRALRDAKLDIKKISEVIMVGGSTKILRVREKVGQLFARTPHTEINPDEVVAVGAALQADILVGNKPDADMLLLDVIPLSLGLETMGGLTEKIIARNTPIPVTRAQEFTTFKDGQTAMSIHVVQGEREMVADNRSLAKFELHDIPPLVAGAARIVVTFKVDADGLLAVSAEEKTTSHTTEVTVKPAYGLEDSEIEQMIRSSFTSADQDKQARALAEQQVEAKRLLEALISALGEDGDKLLSVAEKESIEQSMLKLVAATEQGEVSVISQRIDDLNNISQEFAARRMDKNIKQALAGRKAEEI